MTTAERWPCNIAYSTKKKNTEATLFIQNVQGVKSKCTSNILLLIFTLVNKNSKRNVTYIRVSSKDNYKRTVLLFKNLDKYRFKNDFIESLK